MTVSRGFNGGGASERPALARRLALAALILTGAYFSGGCAAFKSTASYYDIPQPDGSTLEVKAVSSTAWDGQKPKNPDESLELSVMGPDGEWRQLSIHSEQYKSIAAVIYRPAVTGCQTNGACYDFQPFGDPELGVRPKS
ncbi:MAG: hypothetical protein AB7G34_16385 [Hyphomicrobiales bacterium]